MHQKTTVRSKAEMEEILSTARRFVEEELFTLESENRHLSWNQLLPKLEEKRVRVKELGLWTPQIPREWGGLGLTLWEFGRLSAILGQSPFGHYCFNCQAPDAGNMEILIEFGSPEQQVRFLKPLLAGEIRSCFAMTEPEHAGSNPIYMSTIARREGEEYIIDGHKWFTTGAEGASFAVVMAMTDPGGSDPHRRASQIIVPLNNPGYRFLRNIPIMGESGEGWLSHAEIAFENCRVPITYRLGGEGEGFAIAQSRLGPGRIHHCMRWIGICERAFDMMCRYALHRELAPGQPLANKQTVQNWIAESCAEINAARLLVLDAAQKIDNAGQYGARTEISIIKFFCANVLQQVLDRAIQVHGGLGITEDTPLSFWFRHERGARIYDGADEVHKSRVARHILKGYKT